MNLKELRIERKKRKELLRFVKNNPKINKEALKLHQYSGAILKLRHRDLPSIIEKVIKRYDGYFSIKKIIEEYKRKYNKKPHREQVVRDLAILKRMNLFLQVPEEEAKKIFKKDYDKKEIFYMMDPDNPINDQRGISIGTIKL